MAAQAKTVSDTYSAVQYAILALRGSGDLHALFFSPDEWRKFRSGNYGTTSSPPSVSVARGRLGLIIF